MPDDDTGEDDFSLTGNIEADYDSIDIKNPELFSLLEAFYNQYNVFMDTLEEEDEDVGNSIEVYDTFKRLYEKLLNNAYIGSSSFLENEDIDPASLNKFIENVFNDVYQHIKKHEEDGVSEAEMMALVLPEEFGYSTEMEGNPNAEGYRAKRMHDASEKAKETLELYKTNPLFKKKYEALQAAARKRYLKMKADPEKWKLHQAKRQAWYQETQKDKDKYDSILAREKSRQTELRKKMKEDPELYVQYRDKIRSAVQETRKKRVVDIEQLAIVYKANAAKIGLLPDNDPEKSKLINENKKLQQKMTAIAKVLAATEQSSFHVSREKEIEDRKVRRDSGTLDGVNLSLKQKTQSAKSEIKKKLLKSVDKHPEIIEIRLKITAAFALFKESPTEENKENLKRLEAIAKNMADTLVNVNPIFIKASEDINQIENFRKMVEKVVKQESLPFSIEELISMGEKLIVNFNKEKEYKSPLNALQVVLDSLRNQ
jgi:hypothetical protein